MMGFVMFFLEMVEAFKISSLKLVMQRLARLAPRGRDRKQETPIKTCRITASFAVPVYHLAVVQLS